MSCICEFSSQGFRMTDMFINQKFSWDIKLHVVVSQNCHIFKKIFIRLLDVFIQPFTCPKSVLTMEAASKQDTNMIHLYVLIHKESMVWKYRQNREYRHKVLYTVSVYTFNITMHYFIDFKCRSIVNYYRPASWS